MTPMTRAQRAEYRKTEEETQLDVRPTRLFGIFPTPTMMATSSSTR